MRSQESSIASNRKWPLVLVAATCFVSIAPIHAAPNHELRELIPSEAIAVIVNQFAASDQPVSGDPATALLRGASAMGLLAALDESTRAWLDAWEALALLNRYSHAVGLFDLSAEPNGQGGSRLAGLSGFLIIDARQDDTTIPGHIQQLLDRHSNKEDGTLASRKVDGIVVHELTDRRLPPWAVISWSALGRFQLIGIGPQAVDRVLARFKETEERFPKPVGAARGSAVVPPDLGVDGTSRGLWIPPEFWAADTFLVLDVDALIERMGRSLATKSARTRGALELGDVSVIGLTLRRTGRDVEIREWRRYVRRERENPVRSTSRDWFASDWVSPRHGDDRALRVLPQAASFTAFVEVDPLRMIALAGNTYRAARSPKAVWRAENFWNSVQLESGVDIRKDIAARLGHRWIVHDSPRHALGLPLAWTILIPVEGDVSALRTSVDRLLIYAASRLETSPVPPWHIRRDASGLAPIWYLYFGLNGPALAITDRWVIVSFSPHAVARNVSLQDPGASSK